MNVTQEFERWKESTRNVWNMYFLKDGKSDWDAHEIYEELEKLLFEQIVLRAIGIDRTQKIEGKFKLSARSNSVIPVMINRDGDGGSWDHPLTAFINDTTDIEFIEYFDWDQLGVRDNRYIIARIIASKLHPEVNGHKAIIETQYVDVYYEKSA